MPESMTLDGLEVTVERPRNATRPSILFVHGMFGGAWYWEKYQRFFAELGYPSYAVDLRGHNRSRPVPDIGKVRVGDYVEDALAVARWMAAQPAYRHGADPRPIVIGHSMGGLIAQKLAESDAVRAAVLLSPAPPRGIPPLGWTLIRKLVPHLHEVLGGRAIVGTSADHAALTLNCVPAAERPALSARFVPDSGTAGREILFGVRVDAARVRCPLLVVGASHDHFVPMGVTRRVAARYRATLRVYFGHAHFIMWEPEWQEPATEIEHWLDHTLHLGRHSSPGMIHFQELAKQRGRTVRLSFTDGHIVEAKIVAVDFDDPPEVIYEVRGVIERGPEAMEGVGPGRVAAAPLWDLREYKVLS